MNPQAEVTSGSRLRVASRFLSIAVWLIGSVVLVGWLLDVPILRSGLPGHVSMKANSALSFVLSGFALLFLSGGTNAQRRARAARICALVVALVGFLSLVEYVLGWDLHLDQWLFLDHDTAGTSIPGRPAPNTSLNFLLLGLALLLTTVRERRSQIAAQLLALAAALVTILAILGYAYTAQDLYGIAAYTPMAWHTAMAFALLCLAVLFARPTEGLMGVVSGDTPAGLMVRWLGPAVAVILPVLGGLMLAGQEAGLYPVDVGISLLVVSAIVVFGGLIAFNARSLLRLEVERRRAEADASRLAAIVASSDDAIVGKDLNGTIVSWNPGAEKLYGYSAEEIVGKPVSLLFAPDRQDELIEILARVGRGEHVDHYETSRVRKDGSQFDVSVTVSPIKEPSGRIVGASTIARDITERKAAEEEREKLLVEVDRRAAELDAANKELEAFSYSVSHDLRAPLRGIDGFSQALLEDYADKLDEDGRECLRVVRSESQRMAELIDALLTLSRITRVELRWETVDLSALACKVAAGLRKAEPERLVEFAITPDLAVEGDPRLLQVVLENLIGNSWKFTAKHSRAKIEFGAVDLEGRLTYFVRDDGAGFDMAYSGHLFGAFQRLHGQSEFSGTGVGLATVQRIIRRHGGRIWAEGQVEKGATFYFTL